MTDALHNENENLNAIIQQLKLVNHIALRLSSATDLAELQTRLLIEIIDKLGLTRAAIALPDSTTHAPTNWFIHAREYAHPLSHSSAHTSHHSTNLANDRCASPLTDAIRKQTILSVTDGRAPSTDATLNATLNFGECYYLFPLMFHEKALNQDSVGILIVTAGINPLPAQKIDTLTMLTKHAQTLLGSLHRSIQNAQNQAIEEERGRIAADIHDTVSQSLFGLAYGINACTEMLPNEPANVLAIKQQLTEMQPLVFDTLSQIRSVIMDILPGDLSRNRFISTLQKQLSSLTLGSPIQLTVVVPPQFNQWSMELRQQLMLITHEAIANIAKHATASNASVEMRTYGRNLHLIIADDGKGFEQHQAIFVAGLGIDSIRQRVERLNGVLEITSKLEEGTQIVARIPIPRS